MAVCPVDAIDLPDSGFPEPAVDAEDVCIRCGHCLAVCPTGSFRHRELDPAMCPPVEESLQPSKTEVQQLFRSRRSIRAYKEKPVGQALLQELIEMASAAPSAHNSQKVRWLVIAGREQLDSLAALTVDWMRWVIGTMPERAGELHFGRRVKRWERGQDGILRGAPVLIVAHGEKELPVFPPGFVPELDNVTAPLDYAIALSYLELAATSLGLGACWAGYVYKAANIFPPMHRALGLPEGHQCFGAMMVGYPRYTYRRIPRRDLPVITWRS
jgi:nitroreductase